MPVDTLSPSPSPSPNPDPPSPTGDAGRARAVLDALRPSPRPLARGKLAAWVGLEPSSHELGRVLGGLAAAGKVRVAEFVNAKGVCVTLYSLNRSRR